MLLWMFSPANPGISRHRVSRRLASHNRQLLSESSKRLDRVDERMPCILRALASSSWKSSTPGFVSTRAWKIALDRSFNSIASAGLLDENKLTLIS